MRLHYILDSGFVVTVFQIFPPVRVCVNHFVYKKHKHAHVLSYVPVLNRFSVCKVMCMYTLTSFLSAHCLIDGKNSTVYTPIGRHYSRLELFQLVHLEFIYITYIITIFMLALP